MKIPFLMIFPFKYIHRSDIWYIDLSKVKKEKKVCLDAFLVKINYLNYNKLEKQVQRGSIYTVSDWKMLSPGQDMAVERHQGMS